MPTIDNFAEIRKHLRFDNPGDFYVAHIMFRVKDIRNDEEKSIHLSHEETQRLVKTYYIDSLEYFDRKLPAMKDLAEKNGARVYFMMTRRNRMVVNRVLAKKVIEYIDDPNVRYDHLIRSAVCGCHISDCKWWLLDVDDDTVVRVPNADWELQTFSVPSVAARDVRLMDIKDKVIADMAKLVDETKSRSGSEIFTVPTRNGCHIMTPPFNKAKMPWLGDNLKTDALTLAYFAS